jgi:hypothetical protein
MNQPGGSARDMARLRELLLGLIRPGPAPELPPLDEGEWQALDRMAALHRLQPLLHHLRRDEPNIPAPIRQSWQEAYRNGAVSSLILQGELRQTMALLREAGTEPIALKGAWLAWQAYPHPALRPMRDLDILLTADTAIAGFNHLLAKGYVQAEPSQLPLEEVVRLDKHMPPLWSPRGVMIELHQRLWEVDGRMDHAAPAGKEAEMRGRAITVEGMSYLAPRDLLAHLIIHAVYDHRLDCGPLVLSDIAFLLRTSTVDWDGFWADAVAGNWLRGARLVLELVRGHDPALAIPPPPGEESLPEGLGPLAASLLLQNLETRQSAGVWATWSAAGPQALVRRLLARRGKAGEEGTVARNLEAEGGFAAWAGSRLWRTLRDLSQGEVRRQSRGLSQLSRWLDV